MSASCCQFFLAKLDDTAGPQAKAPADWPDGTPVARKPERSTLVMVAHPHCPCTRASLAELARLMSAAGGSVDAHVLFLKPQEMQDGWERSDLWRRAESIPGVRVGADVDGRAAARFGATVSGQVVLYDGTGRLLFRGGITGARGHEGDNTGRTHLTALIRDGGGAAAARESRVAGTRFSIELPAARPEASRMKTRILIVDDEPSVLETLVANLELDDRFEVAGAANGAQALAMVEKEPFDVVLSDVKMPGMNGVELFRCLTQARPGMPVVLMTAFAGVRALPAYDGDAAVHAVERGTVDVCVLDMAMSGLGAADVVPLIRTRDDHVAFIAVLPEAAPSAVLRLAARLEGMLQEPLDVGLLIDAVAKARQTDSLRGQKRVA